MNQQATRTIKYEFTNGKPAAAAVSQPVAYTRSADIDEVTGDVVYTPWTAAPAKYPPIVSPTILGYFTNTRQLLRLANAWAKSGCNGDLLAMYRKDQDCL